MGSFRDLAHPKSLAVLVLLGLGLTAFTGWQRWQESRLLAGAVPVEAEVLASDVESFTTGTAGNRERHWKPVVRFRYEHAGTTHESARVTPLDSSGARGWAEELAGRFAAGDRVQAWVDPRDPSRAYLLKITAWKPLVGMIAGVLIAVGCAIGLWVQRRRRCRVTPA